MLELSTGHLVPTGDGRQVVVGPRARTLFIAGASPLPAPLELSQTDIGTLRDVVVDTYEGPSMLPPFSPLFTRGWMRP